MTRTLVFVGWLLATLAVAQPAKSPFYADSLHLRQLWDRGDSLSMANDFVGSKAAYDQALQVARNSPYPDGVGVSYRGLGWYSEMKGDYNEALSWYQKALQELKEHGTQRSYVLTFKYAAFVLDRLNKIPEAKRYLRQGITLAEQLPNHDLLLQRLYGVLINVYDHNKQYDSALVYSDKVLAYFKQRKSEPDYYGQLYNTGLIYKNLHQYERAEQAFRDVLAFGLKTNDKYMESYSYVSLPYALIPQNKLDEAELYSQKALAVAGKFGTDRFGFQEDANGHLNKIWEKRGDYKKALDYYKAQVAAHDSIFNATKNRQVAELESRYQTLEKEASIRELGLVNAQQTKKIWAASGGLVLLSLLLGTLFVFYRRVRRSRAKIAQQSDQLTLMMRELHHRVKNNLAIVSSLLKLQSNRLDDEKAVQAVRMGQQRVEAMSLIHQRLYQTNEVTTVNMREYLADLAESLMHAYGYQRDDFDLQLNIGIKALDVDIAMPLGLIVNELATNAFKYAYAQTDGKRPLLHIRLFQQNELGEPGITLEVQDNGPGIEQDDWQQPGKKSSFGKRLIASLTEQLEGHFELLKQNGTLFRLHMPVVRAIV